MRRDEKWPIKHSALHKQKGQWQRLPSRSSTRLPGKSLLASLGDFCYIGSGLKIQLRKTSLMREDLHTRLKEMSQRVVYLRDSL